jgi:hypothetical protein
MALVSPPSWLQAGSYPAESDRQVQQAIYATTGIIGTSSLAITANSPAGMSVLAATGWAAVVGTTQANMGTYVFYNDATTTLTVTTADPTNPRIDRVVATVRDAYYTGAFNDVIFQVIAGTPAGSPVAPAIPANSISLATIAVGAAVTQINTGNITDTRTNVTTNLPVGDLTEVQGGTGITVTNGTGPIPSVAINSTVATLTGTQTLTNKTLTTPIISSISNSGTITVPTGTDTLVGRATTDTLTNKTLTTPIIASISNSGTITIPTGTDTLVGRATTDTLTNKTLTSPTINDPKLNLSINANTATTYTFVLADNGKLVTSNNASAQTLSIPTNASVGYAIGTQITVAWITGAGQPTINAVSSGTTTVLSTGATANAPKLRVVNSVATCIKIATDTWLVTGDIA